MNIQLQEQDPAAHTGGQQEWRIIGVNTACCNRCGHVGLEGGEISMAFWRDGGLIVIRAIPALVCPSCREEHIVDGTVLALDRMRGAPFQTTAAVERIAVPVFHFVDAPGA